MERNENLIEYIVDAIEDDDDDNLYKFRLRTNTTLNDVKDRIEVLPDETLEEEVLDKLQNTLDYMEIKNIAITK
jgi:hypothetical protein